MERFHSSAPGSAVGDGFRHDGDLDEVGPDDLLRTGLHPRANPSDRSQGNEPEPERAMDEADRQECDRVGGGTCRSALLDPRPRLQIHPVLRPNPEYRQYRGRETSATLPEPECVCGAVREDHQNGMRGAVRPLRRKRLAACDPGVLGALSRRTQSSGDRQCHSLSRPTVGAAGSASGKGGTPWRVAELLPPSSYLTKVGARLCDSPVASQSCRLASGRPALGVPDDRPLNRNSMSCRSLVVPAALLWRVKSRTPTSDEYFDRMALNTASAIWVGIDGNSDSTVEQIGTEQDWTSGSPVYYAWFDMYPAVGYMITTFPVQPGDEISAEVQFIAKNKFVLS